ncbi:NHLP leader peptide family RiPP precursor [Nostoc sp. FACHB-888]|uniref:NHLP leader peptide family RiPP precursor n=1 Tax=Nostoc sp. FACHB-888 TaxID=2692842 RepID=UPI0016855C2E|nr:NHLP leader peptide family RiPP precursor [Nostoc sp. FACHB-888]MBD2243787.1 NHLP leader peptide family natural product precursor [Nostoc sp. FACHB-888]
MTEPISSRNRKDIEAHIIAQAWKNEVYKQELLSNSKAVIAREFNVQLPAEVNVRVLEENPTTLYFVLPIRPNLSGSELSDAQLEAVAGGVTPGALAVTIAANMGAALGIIEDLSD